MAKRTAVIGLAAVACAVAVGAGAAPPDPGRPSESRAVAPSRPVVAMALPDIAMKIETDGTVAVQNIGDVNVGKPFGVDLMCNVKTATVPSQTCGAPFDAAGRWFQSITLPPGTKQAPLKEAPGQQTFIRYGPGWAMLYPAIPSWRKGVYTLSGCANPNPADPAKRVAEKTKNNNCSFADVTRP